MPNWRTRCMPRGIRWRRPFYARACFPHTRFVNGLPCSYISIEASLLSAPPFENSAEMANSPDPIYFSRPASDFIGSLKQLLATYLSSILWQSTYSVTFRNHRNQCANLAKAHGQSRHKLSRTTQAHHVRQGTPSAGVYG